MKRGKLTRQERYDYFNKFFSQAQDLFNEIYKNDKEHSKLKDLYGFSVESVYNNKQHELPNVIVYFNDRPYCNMVVHEACEKENKKESGPKLIYRQMDNGNILISLYPACIYKKRLTKNTITLDYLKDVRKLFDKKYIKKHFKYLVSYLAVTSIDYDPNFVDRIRLFYLRNYKRHDRKNTIPESKLRKHSKKFALIIATAIVSVILTLFISFFAHYKRDKFLVQAVKSVTNNLNDITNTLNELNIRNIIYHYSNISEEVIIELTDNEDE